MSRPKKFLRPGVGAAGTKSVAFRFGVEAVRFAARLDPAATAEAGLAS